MSASDAHQIWIQGPKDKAARPYSVEDFERIFQMHYSSQLVFEDEAERTLVKQQCARMEARGQILDEQRWLGSLYRDAIRRGSVAPVEVRYIGRELGYGLFARSDLLAGAFVAEFTGRVLRKRWLEWRQHDYRFRYPTARFFWQRFTIDAAQCGNEARFVNHSEEPNVQAASAYCRGSFHIILTTSRAVKAGEQLCFDYGPEYWKQRKAPQAVP